LDVALRRFWFNRRSEEGIASIFRVEIKIILNDMKWCIFVTVLLFFIYFRYDMHVVDFILVTYAVVTSMRAMKHVVNLHESMD
jgi:hypothetical protein